MKNKYIFITIALIISFASAPVYAYAAKTPKCPKNTVEFSNPEHGYALCYGQQGEVKRWQYGIQYSVKRGGDSNGEYFGSIEVSDHDGTLESYIALNPDGITQKKAFKTKKKFSAIEYDQYAGGGGGYTLLIHNPKTKKIVIFFYSGAKAKHKKFTRKMADTLRFL